MDQLQSKRDRGPRDRVQRGERWKHVLRRRVKGHELVWQEPITADPEVVSVDGLDQPNEADQQ